MTTTRETDQDPARQDVPVHGSSGAPAGTDPIASLRLDDVLGPLREVLTAVGEAQRRSEAALQSVIDRLDEQTKSPPDDAQLRPRNAGSTDAPRVVGVRHESDPRSEVPAPAQVHPPGSSRAAPDPHADEGPRPAPWEPSRPRAVARDRDEVARSTRAHPASGESNPKQVDGTHSSAETCLRQEPEPPKPTESPPTPRPVAAADSGESSPSSGTSDAASIRRSLAGLQRAANEIDRISDGAALERYLWEKARKSGLRAMRLSEKGRALYAEDCFGFVNFEGERRSRLRKVVIPFDPDGLFGVTAQERALYSGPRPAKGIPVDLVLVMGKHSPSWCLVVPLPYRNRWGTFLYIDGDAGQIESILELELIARLCVLQLRAARFRPHEPAERVRAFRAQTLRDRQRRRERRIGRDAKDDTVEDPGATGTEDSTAGDPLSRKRGAASASTPPAALEPPEAERFDADGNLVRPLDGNAILSRMGELPPMPNVAARLIGMLGDPSTEIQAIQEAVSTDQSISVRLLQIANSSLYGSMREVSTVGEAVMRLGFTAIRSWLMATVTRSVFLHKDSPVGQHRLWRQSVISALAAKLLAEKSSSVDPDTAFTAGLLQNIGLLLLARNHPDVFEQLDERCRADELSYHLVERTMLGFDHADLGGLILQKWGLGEILVSAVSSHHRLGSAGASEELASIVALAEEIALRVGEGPTETSDADLSTTDAAAHLDLDSEAIEAVSITVGEQALDRALFSD